MTMIAKDSPRRLYVRKAHGLVLCYTGKYFGPKAGVATDLTKDDQVTVEVLRPAGARHRIKVTQVVSQGKALTETWTEKELVFTPRSENVA